MQTMKERLLQAIPRLAGQRILVIGDLILDEYLTGAAARLSREAPIPVLEFEHRRTIPGGAANPAMNIAALGSQAIQVGLVGSDRAGEELIQCLRESNIETQGIVVDSNRCTTQKTRILAQGSLRFPQQLVRLDRIDRHPPDAGIQTALVAQIRAAISRCQAILVSDYRNGLLTAPLVQAIREEAANHARLLLVDSQGHLDKYQGYGVIRANRPDTEAFLGRSLGTENTFETAMAGLLKALNAEGLVIGRGAQGVSVLGRSSAYYHFSPANVTEVFDVTGAGDTSIAVLALALGAGLTLAEAAQLANYAAGLVVQKLGNATPTAEALTAAIERWG
jgi:rfaE bifunctional protein kinase chain/domain